MSRKSRKKCSYCGKVTSNWQMEHVFPKCLYPISKSGSRVQRLTIPACSECNKSWQDDEVQFRNVLMAGDLNEVVQELWQTKVSPSFDKVDGHRRVMDLFKQMIRVETDEGERYKIDPNKDEMVMRVVRKVIRGLCHHHKIMSPVSDQRVLAASLPPDSLNEIAERFKRILADPQKVPQRFLKEMAELLNRVEYHHREKDIAEYGYVILDESDEPLIHSFWLITFYAGRSFIGIVSTSEGGFP